MDAKAWQGAMVLAEEVCGAEDEIGGIHGDGGIGAGEGDVSRRAVEVEAELVREFQRGHAGGDLMVSIRALAVDAEGEIDLGGSGEGHGSPRRARRRPVWPWSRR